eukprot:TRINITY_DN19232_c0_g1_i1.p2 TRINITY_DN19232_c0_g1~~TRINITY_DN19232_c0_g1_i1.p2  ORF type:complete len:285 (-),score=45.01 TRINITY_DN19232_c0_g1_i1:196-1050(-)
MYHMILTGVTRVEVRYFDVTVNRKAQRELKARMRQSRLQRQSGRSGPWPFPPLEPEDLNTDGIDIAGQGVWVHDCVIVNDDDSIAVKPLALPRCSADQVWERLTLTGFGASIGSVPPRDPPNCVRNVTIRNVTMPGTGKGIYVKSNPECDAANPNKTAVIEAVLYEDVRILHPVWWAIWIGPQQQHEPHTDLGRKCALDYPIDPHCPTQGCVTFSNITLRRVSIESPLLSPGVVLGNATNPMRQVTFEDVVVRNASTFPFGGYQCEFAALRAVGSTSPVPDCRN